MQYWVVTFDSWDKGQHFYVSGLYQCAGLLDAVVRVYWVIKYKGLCTKKNEACLKIELLSRDLNEISGCQLWEQLLNMMSIVNPIDLLFYNQISNYTWSDQLAIQLLIILAIGIAIEPRTWNIIAIKHLNENNYVHNWKGWLQLFQLIGIDNQCQQLIGRFDSKFC